MKAVECVRQFFNYYLPQVKGCSNTTITGYKDTFKFFLPFASRYAGVRIDALDISDWSTEMILSFLDYLEMERNNCIKTRNHRLSAIKSMARMIRLLHPEHHDTVNRILNIPQKREKKPLFGFLTHDELLAVFDSVDLSRKEGFRDYVILHLLFDSAVRASEIAGLELNGFFPDDKRLGVIGKGNRYRLVQLQTKTVELVKRYIEKHRPVPKPLFKNRLFINQRREGLTRHGIYRICEKYLKKVLPAKRLKNLHPVHCFRHSCAVHMLMTGHDISDIKNHLGHEDIQSTMIYLKLDLSRRREVQKKFIDYMQSNLKTDSKLDELIDWQNKEELLQWLDTL